LTRQYILKIKIPPRARASSLGKCAFKTHEYLRTFTSSTYVYLRKLQFSAQNQEEEDKFQRHLGIFLEDDKCSKMSFNLIKIHHAVELP
jgi:hypothetical protein